MPDNGCSAMRLVGRLGGGLSSGAWAVVLTPLGIVDLRARLVAELYEGHLMSNLAGDLLLLCTGASVGGLYMGHMGGTWTCALASPCTGSLVGKLWGGLVESTWTGALVSLDTGGMMGDLGVV